jgi:multidrug efflux pump subunit AcrA (membrane-fusion protein)
VFGLLVATGPDTPVSESEERVWVVEARTVQPEPRSPRLALYGHLESPSDAVLSAAVSADVQAVPAAEGKRVEPGERLVTLDAGDVRPAVRQRRADLAEIEAQLAEARAQYEADQRALAHEKELVALARREVDRAERLAGRDVGSQAEVDAARRALHQAELSLSQRRLAVDSFSARLQALKARRERAEARLAEADRDLERTRVDAPFAGQVARVEVAPGDRVRPGDPLVRLYAPARLEVRATIPGPHVAAVRRALRGERPVVAEGEVDGEPVRVVLDRLAGRSPSGGGVDALFRLAMAEPPAAPLGRFVSLRLTLPPQPRLVALPHSALYGGNRIYAIREGRLRPFTVERVGETVGPEGEPRVLVRAPGLDEGEEVLVTQLPNAMGGLRVRLAGEGEGGDGAAS